MFGDERGDLALCACDVRLRQPGGCRFVFRIVTAVVEQADRLLEVMQGGKHGFIAVAGTCVIASRNS